MKREINSRAWSSQKNKKRTLFALTLSLTAPLLLFSNSVLAHVRWFVTDEGEHKNSHFSFDNISFCITSLFFGFIFLCVALDRASVSNINIKAILYKHFFSKNYTLLILQISVVAQFSANLIQKNFVAPNFISNPINSLQLTSQLVLLLAAILNLKIFSYLLVAFSLMLFAVFPLESAIDYSIELLAIAVCIFFMLKDRKNKTYFLTLVGYQYSANSTDLGLMLLRLGLGIQLVILTLHDKLLHPGLALHFLDHHPQFNFPYYFGLSGFSNIHFVLAAGLAELSFGLILAINFSTRISLVCIIFFFFLTGCILDIHELMGHIPILATAIILFNYPKEGTISMFNIKHTQEVIS